MINENLQCPLCLDVFYEPVEHILCGNMFCLGCLTDIKSCPICRGALAEDNVKPISVRMILGAISDIHYKCADCHQKVLRNVEKEHREVCLIKCEDCQTQFLKKDEREHHETSCSALCQICRKITRLPEIHQCEFRKVVCSACVDGCDWRGFFNERIAHEVYCQYVAEKRMSQAQIERIRWADAVSGKNLCAIMCPHTGMYLSYKDGKVCASNDGINRLWVYFEHVSENRGESELLKDSLLLAFRIKVVLDNGLVYYLERSEINNNQSYIYRDGWAFDLNLFIKPTQYWWCRKVSSDNMTNIITTDDDVKLLVIGENGSKKHEESSIPGFLILDDYGKVIAMDHNMNSHGILKNLRFVYPRRVKSKELMVMKK